MEPQQAPADGGQAGASPGADTTAADAANMVRTADTTCVIPGLVVPVRLSSKESMGLLRPLRETLSP